MFDAGIAFEERVTVELVALLGDDCLAISEDWDESATVDAMRRGVPVIINGRLPRIGGRVGAPDVLLFTGAGYLPVDIKNHRVLEEAKNARTTATVSPASAPLDRGPAPFRSNKASHWHDDAMQLAHYTRMLQDLGLDAGEMTGGLIGTDDLSESTGCALGITWIDLAADGSRDADTVADQYDREFALRLKVAHTARAGGEMVRPLHISDCGTCAWLDYCRSVVPADDASFSLAPLWLPNRLEWALLYGRTGGGMTLADLAGIDVGAVLGEIGGDPAGKGLRRKLPMAVRRARMAVAGRDLEPLEGCDWPEPPGADVEVDFDIEWDSDGRVYQWGLRIRDGHDESTARYEPVVSFESMDDHAERSLANRFADKMITLIEEADRAGLSLSVFHWTSPETSRTRKFPRVAAALDGHTVDLESWLRKRTFSRFGFSIKQVAPLFGFHWGVDDPGGLASQEYVDRARNGDGDARRWCLTYNESDVAAQAAIRDGLRRLTRGA